MRGHIRKKGIGWQACVKATDPATGKARQLTATRRTKAEAEAALVRDDEIFGEVPEPACTLGPQAPVDAVRAIAEAYSQEQVAIQAAVASRQQGS